jgi:glycosyltransferase involved in cell wall biosynthesis
MPEGHRNEFTISVVTPTLRRPEEVEGLLKNLLDQEQQPIEVILVDGAPIEEKSTEELVLSIGDSLPFNVVYIRHQGGTAVQRNAGIDAAQGQLIALIDDDVRLQEDFLKTMVAVFDSDTGKSLGGVVGYRTNQNFNPENSERWWWYKRLGLFTVYEPGRYDFKCGYPINNNMQSPFSGIREVDFMTTACAVWNRDVFDSGLRFDSFFKDYGVLEDAHFSLMAGSKWKLLQCGDAHCEELHSPNGRVSRKKLGYKCVVNYYYVFNDIVGPLSFGQKFRFWRFQAFELFRIGSSAVRRWSRDDLQDLLGRAEGILSILL